MNSIHGSFVKDLPSHSLQVDLEIPITGHKQSIYNELYASDAWSQAHDKIMK